MEWTFGIITGGGQEERISKIVDSIENQKIPKEKYEIVVVGACKISRTNFFNLDFDESLKPKWITKKKNLIAEKAKFSNLVIMHDYLEFLPDWYSGFCKFGDKWDVSVNRVTRQDGVRYLDWFQWKPKMRLLDYSDHSHVIDNTMFVPGFYFCVKKDFMIKHPLDESLVWGEGEDVEWSERCHSFWDYRCNPDSEVRFLKKNRMGIEENGSLNTKENGEFIFP